MTQQPGSADDRQDSGAEPAVPAVRPGLGPEVRATHADRDRTVERLRDAAADGQLTADELDERVAAALTARTGSELAARTADLGRAGPAALTVTVSGQVRGGNVAARYPRRSFGQWMRREPRPYRPAAPERGTR